LQVFLALLNLKSEKARVIICGKPTILIENGKIRDDELRRTRINLNGLLEQMRAKDCFNIADVEFAILETNGHLSILLKSQRDRAAGTKPGKQYEGLPTNIFIVGQVTMLILKDNLMKTAKTRIIKRGIYSIKEGFVCQFRYFRKTVCQTEAGGEETTYEILYLLIVYLLLFWLGFSSCASPRVRRYHGNFEKISSDKMKIGKSKRGFLL
jgi:uncharacterized membrane protein YcaP (DUF421 family)